MIFAKILALQTPSQKLATILNGANLVTRESSDLSDYKTWYDQCIGEF